MFRRRFLLSILLALSFLQLTVPASAQVHLEPTQLAGFEGEFTPPGRPEAAASFYVQDGHLVYETERILPRALNPLTPTSFAVPSEDTSFRFTLDASGKAIAVTASDHPKDSAPRSGAPVRHLFHPYTRTEFMIPMRDGVKLHTILLKPADIATPLPFLITRTPYGIKKTNNDWLFQNRPNLAREGYLYVAQDIRGCNGSEGQFVMSRPLAGHADRKATDESTDAWDTVAWLLKNVVGNNGRAGFLGTSYPGFLAMAAGIDPHPAVKAISPQAPMIDVWMGDDFFHNGAFRLSYGYDYVYGMESAAGTPEVDYGYEASGDSRDGFSFFLQNGNFENSTKRSGLPLLPTWKLFLEHPAYDPVWRARGVEHWLNAVTVPTLSVGGSYDQEDLFGPQEEYARLEPHDTAQQNFLVLGPWQHGAWAQPSRATGQIQWGNPTGDDFRKIENAFFAHYLKDAPGFDLIDTASFQTGSNQWKRYPHFPPAEAQPTRIYLAANGQLSWTAPATESTTSYVSDPASPVPYRHQPIQPTYESGSNWGPWLTEDQRFVTSRKDVAVWKLPVLTKELTLTGNVEADLFSSTTGSDGDLIVKLIDQYPDDDPDPAMRGYQLMINEEIFRGRYLDSFEEPKALEPGIKREYKFSLHAADHVFRLGHTVLVEVQSSWFPLYDRNPQTFVPNIMTAQPGDYKPATITLHSGPEYGSSLILPIVSR